MKNLPGTKKGASMPSRTTSSHVLVLWLLAFLTLVSASLKTRGPTIDMPFSQKMNRLNYHYYLHDDSSFSKEPLIVRLGLAQYWNDVKGIRRPSQLPGLTLSVNRSIIGGPNDGLIMPTVSISYEIPLSIVDEHMLDQLLPSMFWEEGWNREDEVIGVWVSVPKKNVENRMAKIRIDLGQSKDSALFSNVLSEVSDFLGQLVTEEFDLNINLTAPRKAHPLEGFRTLGSVEHSDWILAARDSHILSDIYLSHPGTVSSALRIIEAESAAGTLILTKRKYWPFDTDAYPLRIQAAVAHPALKYSLCVQMVAIQALEEDSILALGFELVDKQLHLVFWLPSSTPKHTVDRLVEFEKNFQLKYQLQMTMSFLDSQEMFRNKNQPKYDPEIRYPYRLRVMNKKYEHIHLIKTAEDFSELKYSPENPAGYPQTVLERSRLMLFHSANARVYHPNQNIFALVCTTSSNNLESLLKGLDELVSRANAVFYTLNMPPSLILIEPMEAIAEEHSGKGKRRQQNFIKSQGSELLSRFHLMIPSAIPVTDTPGGNNMLSLLWRLIHQFIRSCGIREKIELITMNPFRIEEIKAHAAPVFTQELEKSTDALIKSVTGPSNAEISRAKHARRPNPLTLAQLKERARKNEVAREAEEKAAAEALLIEQRRIQEENRLKEELALEMARMEQVRIEHEKKKLRQAEEAKKLAEEQAAKEKERQAAVKAALKQKRMKEKILLSSRVAYVEPKVYQKTSKRPVAVEKASATPSLTIAVDLTCVVEAAKEEPISFRQAEALSEERHEPVNGHEEVHELELPRRPAKTVLFIPLHPLLPPVTLRRRISYDSLGEFY